MSKRQAITAQTKQNIIDAFWALYRQNPGAPITVRDIVMRAGYNRSTFYEYFRDVPAVLEALEEMIIPTIETLPPFVGAAPQVGMPLEQFWGWYQRYAPYYTVLLGEQGDPRFAGKLKQRVKPKLLELYAHHPADVQIQREYLIEYVLSGMIGVMVHWHRQEAPMPVADLLALMQRVMTQGVVEDLAPPTRRE